VIGAFAFAGFPPWDMMLRGLAPPGGAAAAGDIDEVTVIGKKLRLLPAFRHAQH
jgi:hypothetical protein